MSETLYTAETPDDVKNAKSLHLLTFSTGNGRALQIFLEELSEVYGLKWTTTFINIFANVQKEEWFLRLNPNGRIPVLIDNHQNPPFAIHESSAELLYLVNSVDKEHIFSFEDEQESSEMLQWLFFWHGSATPYLGQFFHFTQMAPEKNEYAINRFRSESMRIYGVLEIRLSGKYTGEPRDYLAGKGKGKYSVADIKAWPWVQYWENAGFTKQEMDQFPHLLQWIDRIAQRSAVQIGIGPKYN
ncbi:glutathione S-transferase [Hypoxylon cercidicola]|nr:glutathione S-transferase [Hypoxylon cercidicola]